MRVQIIAAVLAVAVLVVGVGAGIGYFSIRSQADQLQSRLASDLELGQSNLEAAKANLSQANAKHDPKLVDAAKVNFAEARASFLAAGRLADTNSLLRWLEGLPEVGRIASSRHRAVDGISAMGAHISNAGLDAAGLVAELLQPPGSGSQQGRTMLTVLQDTTKATGLIRVELAEASAAAASVDVTVLSASQQKTFTEARAAIASALASIDTFQGLVPTLVELLGGNGTRTYLVEQVSPAELRPGGGFIGTFSVLQADHGVIKMIRSGSSTDLALPRPSEGEPGYVPAPGPMKQLLLFGNSWSFFDSNFFPDFQSNALAGERFAQPRLGIHLDGVISIDYFAVARVLDLTGPINVPGYPISLTSANFVSTVVSYDLAAVASKSADTTHKAILTAVAGPLMSKLTALGPNLWAPTIYVLNQLVTQRHLQVYFNNPTVESQFDKFAWTGGLYQASAPDYLMNVESNLGGTKANYFVTRHFSLALTRSGQMLHHRLTIDLVNQMPYIYRPNDFYRVYFDVLVTAGASQLSDSLKRMVLPNGPPPAGTVAMDGWMSIAGQGNRRQAVFTWDTPWHPDARGGEAIYWQKEPGTSADPVSITWNDGQGHTFAATTDLGVDRVVTLTPRGLTIGPGHEGAAVLPSVGFGA